eukprot:9497240-Pyramimonas_sp.AAC.1
MRSSGASESVSVRTLCLLPRSARHSLHSPSGECIIAAMSAHPPEKRSPRVLRHGPSTGSSTTSSLQTHLPGLGDVNVGS